MRIAFDKNGNKVWCLNEREQQIFSQVDMMAKYLIKEYNLKFDVDLGLIDYEYIRLDGASVKDTLLIGYKERKEMYQLLSWLNSLSKGERK